MASANPSMRHGGAVRRWGLLAVLILAGCGGGDEPTLSLTMPADFATTLDQVTLSGTVSLPVGSERAGGTLTMPIVTCQLGAYTMTWSNAANGSSGGAFALWDCPEDFARWSALGIPLVAGTNVVTVSITDASHTARGTVTITRN